MMMKGAYDVLGERSGAEMPLQKKPMLAKLANEYIYGLPLYRLAKCN